MATLEWVKFSDISPRKNAKILVITEGIIVECVYYGKNSVGVVLVERFGGYIVGEPDYWCAKPKLPRGVRSE